MGMNEDIKEFKKFIFYHGRLLPAEWIKDVSDYNHYTHNLHHFIKKQSWERNKEWFIERGIEQKLILVPITLHEQLHHQAVRNMSDEEFEKHYGISRKELLFKR